MPHDDYNVMSVTFRKLDLLDSKKFYIEVFCCSSDQISQKNYARRLRFTHTLRALRKPRLNFDLEFIAGVQTLVPVFYMAHTKTAIFQEACLQWRPIDGLCPRLGYSETQSTRYQLT